MLHAYASSVVIYMLIIWAETNIFTNLARDNGWMDAKTARKILNKKNSLFSSFVIALVPIFRLLFAIVFIIVGICKKEDLDSV